MSNAASPPGGQHHSPADRPLPASPSGGLSDILEIFRSGAGFRAILDAVPYPVTLLDAGHRLIAMNTAAEALSGLNEAEARGLPCRHIFRSGLCLNACPMRDPGGTSREATDIITRDRRKLPVLISAVPINDASGNPAGFVEVVEPLEAREAEGDAPESAPFAHQDVVGNSPAMKALFSRMPDVARTDSSVLITGETGTGKDIIAEALHKASPRARHPFIKVNCGALPEALLESELFGHVKGAFTGATDSRPGRFRLAHNGTLFLTEIGDLPLPLQVKLLSVLDDGIVHPLGSSRPVPVNVRIMAATHRGLESMTASGLFRSDLFFRLNVVRLHLPALREREGDIRLLVDHFLRIFSRRFGRDVSGFTPEALGLLLSYSYPGNIRELRNVMEYAVSISRTDRITLTDLPAYLQEAGAQASPGALPSLSGPAPRSASLPHGIAGERPSEKPPSAEPSGGGSFTQSWKEEEKAMIMQALRDANGRRSEAAGRLGWSRSTLWRKMKAHGI